MTPRVKMLLSVAGIAAIVLLVVLVQTKIKPSEMVFNPTPTPTSSDFSANILPTASGNIDDVVDSLIADASNEQTILSGEDANASLLNSDSQEFSDFAKSYDENEL